MEVDGVSLTMGGAAVTAIAGVVGAYIKAKFGKTHIPQPMETQQVGPFVTCGECKQHRAAIGKRIDTVDERIKNVDCDIAAVRNDVSMLRSDINNSNRAVIDKLDEIDKRSEDRAKELYRRIDPLADKTAENAATVAIVKEVFVDTVKSATTGGKK